MNLLVPPSRNWGHIRLFSAVEPGDAGAAYRPADPGARPEVHSCGTVPPHGAKLLSHPEKDFYIAGTKSYGRAPTSLLATGYERVRSIAAALAGDQEAPRNPCCSASPPVCCRVDPAGPLGNRAIATGTRTLAPILVG